MGRNKLSSSDRIKSQFSKAKQTIQNVEKGNADQLYKDVSKIRRNALRDLVYFMLMTIDDYNLLTKHPKEIAKITGNSERKVYDLLTTIRIIQEAEDRGFNNIMRKVKG